MARGDSTTTTNLTKRRDVTCIEARLSLESFMRVKLLRGSVEQQLDRFKRSRALQRHSANLRKPIENRIVQCFQNHKVRFYFTGSEEEKCISFMAKNKIQIEGELELLRTVFDFSDDDSIVHISILEEDEMVEDSRSIAEFLHKSLEDKSNRVISDMLYVFDSIVESRTQLQGYINTLLEENPDLFNRAESKGCRLFFSGEQMFTQRIAVLLERYVKNSLSSFFEVCESISKSSDEILKRVHQDEVDKLINAYFSPRNPKDNESLKNTCLNVAEELKKTFNFQHEPRASFFESYITDFLYGMLLSKMKAKDSKAGVHNFAQCISQKDLYLVSEQIWVEASSVPDVYSEFVKDIRENMKQFETQFRETLTQIRDDDIPHEVETSLARVPGVLSIGFQRNKLHITFDGSKGSDMQEIVELVRCSVGKFSKISKENVSLCKPGFRFDVRSGDRIKGERWGTMTIVARHRKSSDPRMYGITCAHVLSDDPNLPAFLYGNDCQCENPSNNCNCDKNPILIGNCVYRMGPHEENPVNKDLVDIACFLIPQDVEPKFDLRIFGPENSMIIVDQSLQLEGSRIFVRGPKNVISYGSHLGYALLLPAESKHICCLDTYPQYSFQIPFGGLSRRVELVESDSGRLGCPGWSGSLVSIMQTTLEGAIHMRPALVYLGTWPENPESVSMCSRLPESLERLAEKSGGQAEFVLCYNNSSHWRENMSSNKRKRKSDVL